MGRTLHYLLDQCNGKDGNLDELSPQKVKLRLKYIDGTGETKRRTELTKELMNIRNSELFVHGFTRDELDDMFRIICTQ